MDLELGRVSVDPQNTKWFRTVSALSTQKRKTTWAILRAMSSRDIEYFIHLCNHKKLVREFNSDFFPVSKFCG